MNNSIHKACSAAAAHRFHSFRVFLALILAGLSAASAHAQCLSVIWQAIAVGLIIRAIIKFLTKRARFLGASLLACVGCILGAASGFAGTLTIPVPSGGPVLIGDPFLNVPSSLATLLPVFSGNLDGDNVYIYNCSGTLTCYAIDSGSPSGFDDCGFNQLPHAPVIDPGQGFIYVNNQGGTETFTFTGTPATPLLPPASYCGCGSWSLLSGWTNGSSSSYQQVTGFAPQQGAQVSTNYNGGAIEPNYTFSGGVWTPSTPVLTPGRAAFYYVPCSSSCSPVSLSPDPLPAAMPGVFYDQTLMASGGGPFTFGVTSGTLPMGLTLTSAGVLSGEATTLGVYGFTVTATNGTGCLGSQTYYFTNVCATLTLNPGTLPGYTIGAPYSQTINASGSTPPYYYTVTSGALPPGNPAFTLSLDTGVLSGTPTSPGTYCFTVTATTTNGCTGSMTYCLMTNNCPAITLSPPSLNGVGEVGQGYNQEFSASGSSAVPYAFTAPDGTPPGLTLLPNGTLAGTNTSSGIYCFLVTATDTNGCSGSKDYCLTNICPNITLSPSSLPGYTKGVSYNQTITANPSGTPYTFAVTSGSLPPPMTLSPSGMLSGTPTNNGVYCFTVTASEDGCSASMNYCLTNTTCPTITLSPSSLNSEGQVGQAYNSQQLTASGSSAVPYTFTTTPGTLPPGLNLSSSGLLYGTNTSSGIHCFLVTATDTNGCSGSKDYCLTNICPNITLSPSSLPGYTKGVSYNQTITANPSGTPYTFAVTSGSLPPGIPPVTLSPTGVLSGTPTNNGVYCFTVTATEDGCSASMNYCLTNIACPTITLSPSSLNSDGQVGQAYGQQFTASGSTAVPYTFTAPDGTPPGLTLSTSGLLSGTPANNGVYCFLVTATDTNGCSGSGNYCLTNICPTITISPASLPNGTVETSYSQTLTASGGTGPYTFTPAAGTALPPWLALSTSGLLSGTPTTPGMWTFGVSATTTNGCTGTSNYTLTVNCPPIYLAPGSLSAGTVGGSYSQTLTASGGTGPYTFTVPTSSTLPPWLNLSLGGVLSGTPTAAGSWTFTVTATTTNDCTGATNYTLTVSSNTPCLYLACPDNVTTNLPCGANCAVVTYPPIFATNFCDPTNLMVTNSLPSGTCFEMGTNMVTVTAYGSGQSTNCIFTVTVLPCTNCPTITLSPAALPKGTLGSGYSQQLTASGGTAPYTFTVTPGTTLPTGCNLGANGLLSGTPISSTPSCFAVTATDANGCSGSIGYCLTNGSCISLTCPTNPVVTTCVNTMQVFYSGSVTDSCTTDYKVIYNPPSGTVFPLGTTPVSVTVTDALGNIADCGFVVTVLPCTVNGVKYVQWPNTNTGYDFWDSSKWPTLPDGPWFLADDFICTNTGYITDLHLWGSWQGDANYAQYTTFWLGLFTDEPTNASNAFSHPGNLIWEQCFTPGDYSEFLWGANSGNFLDPGSPNTVWGADSQVWYYSFYPTNPPVQHGTPFAPKTYWLGVFAQVNFQGSSAFEFGWHTTTNLQNDISVHAPWVFGSCPASLPQPGPSWTPTYDPSGKPVDLAFAIGTDTNCSCSFLTITPDPAGNGTNDVILTWPSGYLQVATNVYGPYTFVPGITTRYATSPYTNQALPQIISTNHLFWRVDCTNTPSNPALPMTTCDGMALVPGGLFTMGDTVDGDTTAAPTNVTVCAFYMDTNLVSYGQWQTVYTWATSHGYAFDNVGAGKGVNPNYPVQSVDWYDAVKWCNARSQLAGLTPVYYTDTNLTQVYTSGQVTNPGVLWGANGYRLPTEAEWEKAARGGQSGLRFPWGMTISWSQANYYGDPGSYAFDLAPANGYDPAFDTGGFPYTSPVGSFAPNGYGLYDMAGNLQEMCWDWLGTPYGQPTNVNPTGPATGTTRVLRGGAWYFVASTLTCAVRYETEPSVADEIWGFRTVRADIPFNCGN